MRELIAVAKPLGSFRLNVNVAGPNLPSSLPLLAPLRKMMYVDISLIHEVKDKMNKSS